MAANTFTRVQIIPAGIDEVWRFFSDPANLQHITPPSMKMKVISSPDGDHFYAGQLIEYKIRILSVPVYWKTEIMVVNPPFLFIDEQRKGPYKLWHHEHHFKETAEGTEMTDIVQYKIPFWIAGNLAHLLFVKRQVKSIFDYRYQRIKEIFS